MRKFASTCRDRWKKLPLWLKTGLYFVAFDTVLLLVIATVLSLSDSDPLGAYLMSVPACPLMILGFNPIPAHLVSTNVIWGVLNFVWCVLVQCIGFYFVLGAILGVCIQGMLREERK
jgi:hypothetical protein